VDFEVIDQLLLRFFCFHQILVNKWEYHETVHKLFIDFKEAYDSVRKEALYTILREFGIPRKLVRLVKMCLIKHAVKSIYVNICLMIFLSNLV
jgi:hypothetical protein